MAFGANGKVISMSKASDQDRLARLTKYVEQLKQRLSGTVPSKYANRPEVFKQMISIDLKKTLAVMEKLK